MTVREQLEAKYKKPTSPTMTVRQQLEAKYGKTSQEAQPVQQTQPESGMSKIFGAIKKAGDVSGNVLGTINKFTGIESAVDLLGTAGEGFQYVGNKIFGDNKANERLLANPQSVSMKKANTQGTMAGVKDVAGKSLEVGANAAAFASGSGEVAVASKLAKYAGFAKQGAAYGGAFGASNALKENKNAFDIVRETLSGAAKGAAVSVAVPAVFEGTVRAVKNVASLYSGVPKEALEQAFKNPNKVGEAARKYSKDPEATGEILTKANKSFEVIKKARSGDYEKALSELQNSGYKPKTDQVVINDGLNEIINKFNPKVLSPGEVAKMDELRNLYQNWDDFTPLGLNDLKRAIRNRVNIGNSKELNAMATMAEGKLKTIINNTDPAIGKMNAEYGAASDFINNLQKEIFSKRSTMSDSTKLNRLLSIFNQKSDTRLKLVQELGDKAGQDLINEITGAAMSSWLPTGWVQRFVLAGSGLSGLVSPAVMATAPLASPRLVGKGARMLGQASKVLPTVEKYGIPLVNKLINSK